MKYLMVIGALLLVLGGCSRAVKVEMYEVGVEMCKVNDGLKTVEYGTSTVYKAVCNNSAVFRYYEKVE